MSHLNEESDGDQLNLYDQFNNPISTFQFETVRPWSKLTDGYGYSLVADPNFYSDYSNVRSPKSSTSKYFKYWRYSAQINGSPWADDPTPSPTRAIPLIFGFISFEQGWVELINPTTTDVDISGWIFEDRLGLGITNVKDSDRNIYTFLKGTVVKAGVSNSFKISFGPDFLTRDHNPTLFKVDPTLLVYTGDYLEFTISQNELAGN